MKLQNWLFIGCKFRVQVIFLLNSGCKY